jgi:hypothetical protein
MIRTMLAPSKCGTFIRLRCRRIEKRRGFKTAVLEIVAAGIRDGRCPNLPLAPNVSEPAIVEGPGRDLVSSISPVMLRAAIGNPLQNLDLPRGELG